MGKTVGNRQDGEIRGEEGVENLEGFIWSILWSSRRGKMSLIALVLE